MKKTVTLLFFITTLVSFAQKTDCVYDIEEKNDTISLKVLKEYVIYEKVFDKTNEILQFNLLNENGIPLLHVQNLIKSDNFIKANCFDKQSRLVFQLENGKIITLLSVNTNCASLNYNDAEKSNISILEGYFIFTKQDYEYLKTSPISLFRMQMVGNKKEFIIRKELVSELIKETSYPTTYFMNYLKCVE